jgi:uncharacterized membrane protein YdcZ (DUF606 family)
MSETNPHELEMMVRRTPWYAAAGGLLGSILGALLMWWLLHCGCPCVVN